ncbi:DUF6875 domain-containing protein [Corallococcus llansteffanensis]|uniref:DUF6875 domain-containing protein n=1 Tax=Corallococcus llansteffanensis TaxID=2316731 RepID=A0A3A8Q1D1_9BACT|nr:hypothetical protein [Corallococcus llansteffanensis]RKH62569.1 hypothetical protein D7V93_09995 [Corallococcus llansteffanensis]
MRVHPEDPASWLFDLSDLTGPDDAAPGTDLHVARQAVHWARTYLSAPHPELGRPGLVCPFVPRSLDTSLFFPTVRRGADLTPADIEAAVLRYREWFLTLEPREGRDAQYKSILILFPDLRPEDYGRLIDAPQDRLKPTFVAEGLMVGQFHGLPPTNPGLWNPDFRPLKSPVPMLVIRHMVPSDLPFLTDARPLVESYVSRFGGKLSVKQQELITRLHPGLLEQR